MAELLELERHMIKVMTFNILYGQADDRTRLGNLYPSDHYPLWATLAWPPADAA